MATELRAWLEKIGLAEYTDTFISNGYDHVSALPLLAAEDLDTMNIAKPGHRKRLLVYAAKIQAPDVSAHAVSSVNTDTTSGDPAPATKPPPAAVPPKPKPRAPPAGSAPKRPTDEAAPAPSPQNRQSVISVADESAAEGLFVETEETGVLTPLQLGPEATVDEAMAAYIKANNGMSLVDDMGELRMFEVLETPPVERWLQAHEKIEGVKGRWPATGTGRLIVRRVPSNLVVKGNLEISGKMDKRGGGHKNWKSRFFILQDTGIAYYPKAPSKQKDLESPAGIFQFVNSLIYTVKRYRKSPRPALCFCIRSLQDPMWPGSDTKEVMEAFENGCKFVCATSELKRQEWITAILAAQQALIDKGQIYGESGVPAPQDVDEDDDDDNTSA